MVKAVITRKKCRIGYAIVEVDRVRIGTARHHKAALGANAWWTLFVDEAYCIAPGARSENHADAVRLREGAVRAFMRHKTAK